MRSPIASAMFVVLACTSSAHSFEFRCRFVQRIGTSDIALPNNRIDPSNGAIFNLRLQLGVFDDAGGPAPAGGLIGWTAGTVLVSGDPFNSDDRRNPGRLAPWNFSQDPNANGNPPLPAGDPFTSLTDIDATLGPQSPSWGCGAQGVPLPQPAAVIRGRNTFVSVFAFSIQNGQIFSSNYSITFGGQLAGASSWTTVGTPQPPNCGNPSDPSDDVPGSVTYIPQLVPSQAFTCELMVEAAGPAPGPAMLFSIAAATTARRRSRTSLAPR